jgi:hypothetical protein
MLVDGGTQFRQGRAFWAESEPNDGLSWLLSIARTKLPCQAVEFRVVFKQRTAVALSLEQSWLLANGTQEGRPTSSDQASVADVFATNRHKL